MESFQLQVDWKEIQVPVTSNNSVAQSMRVDGTQLPNTLTSSWKRALSPEEKLDVENEAEYTLLKKGEWPQRGGGTTARSHYRVWERAMQELY